MKADMMEEVPSDDDEIVLDERKHNQLLDAISALDGKKKNKLSQRTVVSNQISEFNFTSTKDETSKIDLQELVGSLKETSRHGELKRQLKSVENSKSVPTPLPKHEKQKFDRSVAYEEVVSDLSKWDPIIKKNKHADQIQFPLQKQDFSVVTTDQLVKRFTPCTPLEMQVAALLCGSDHVVQDLEQELTPAEQRALKAMDLDEARERRKELIRHRALLSYKEAKAKRQKKIKSKRYHRILKKDKLKSEKKLLETLKQENPEEFLERMKQYEKDRATERASLKHRGGSKYLKRQMIYSKFDDKARQEVQDMLQKSRELTKKLEAGSDDDEEIADEIPNETGGDAHYSVPSNPWMAKPSTKVMTSEFSRPTVVSDTTISEFSRPIAISNTDTLDSDNDDDAESVNDDVDEGLDSDDENLAIDDDDDDGSEEEDGDDDDLEDFDGNIESVSTEKDDDTGDNDLVIGIENDEDDNDKDVENEIDEPENVDERVNNSDEDSDDNDEDDLDKKELDTNGKDDNKTVDTSVNSTTKKLSKNQKRKLKAKQRWRRKQKERIENGLVKDKVDDGKNAKDFIEELFDKAEANVGKEKTKRKRVKKKKGTAENKVDKSTKGNINESKEIVAEGGRKKKNVRKEENIKGIIEKGQIMKGCFENEGSMITIEKVGTVKGAVQNARKKRNIGNEKNKGNKEENDDIDELFSDDNDEEIISEGLVRKRTLAEIEQGLDNEEIPSETKKRKVNQKEIETGKETTNKEVYIDPSKLFTMDKKIKQVGKGPTLVDDDDDDEEDQRMTIAQAFADDDVIDEFKAEKEDAIGNSQPKDIDLTLPGWGAWGGEGIQISKRKRKRFTIKAPPPLTRTDHHLGNVIINATKHEAIKKYQVSEIPFPYVNAEQFEKSIRAPLGNTWVPQTVHKELVKPKVVTQQGQIITPMDKSEIFKQDKDGPMIQMGKGADVKDAVKYRKINTGNKKHKGKSKGQRK